MIPNLTYCPNYLTQDEANMLIDTIDKQIWRNPFKRRVQHYGYIYDYKKRTITADMFLGILPDWLQFLALKLYQDNHIPAVPDQVIINEYIPGQGITSHIDCEPCFGDTIASISLGSHCIMDFTQIEDNLAHHQVLEPNSLIIMQHEARYLWQHGIAKRKTDKIDGRVKKRQRRLSLTFRRVILDYSK